MAKPAVEFVAHGANLHLIYRPMDGNSWVHDRFARGEGYSELQWQEQNRADRWTLCVPPSPDS